MNFNINFYIFVVIIVVTRNYVQGRLTDVIQTDKGKVRGEIIGTIQNESIKYSSFRGIPYAKPPIGELRFQPPVEADPWSHVLNATSNAPSCPQINEDLQDYDGDEDCLYLNVYSPKTSFNESDNELLAVIVWIYGGGLTAGVIHPTTFGPDFLVADNVLVVAMNYRIGALGFLSLDIPEATGNMAFKDQILALKWIQKNIKNFGGDPNKVTIFGLSSGSQCVTLQHLSPASKGLFRSIIAMSGSTLGPTGFLSTKLAVKQAFQFSSYLGLVGLNKTELFNKLRQIPAKELVQAEVKRKTDGTALAFSPTIENPMIAKDIFLSTCPLKIYQKGNYPMIPAITGYTSTETLIFTGSQTSIFGSAKSGKEYLTKLGYGNSTLIDGLNAIIDNKDINDLSDDAFYLGINITSDITFNVGVDSTQRYLARGSFPVFYYRNSFDYEESRHRIAGINRDGCAHADDVSHIFWQPVKKQPQDPTTRIGVHRTRMARLWTNFVKYLNPTPNNTFDPLVNFTWFPSGPEGFRLEIGNEKMEMKPRLISDTINAIQASTNPYEHADCID